VCFDESGEVLNFLMQALLQRKTIAALEKELGQALESGSEILR